MCVSVCAFLAPWLALLDVHAMLKKGTGTDGAPSTTTCSSFIAGFLKQVYRNKGTLPLEVFVSSQYYADADRTDRTILISEKQPEGDVLVFGLFVEEHGPRAKDPDCAYIQYLEKSGTRPCFVSCGGRLHVSVSLCLRVCVSACMYVCASGQVSAARVWVAPLFITTWCG